MHALLLVLALVAGNTPAAAARDGVLAVVAPALDDSNSYVSGKVSVDVLVVADGSVADVRPMPCGGDALLWSLAEAAVRRWKFVAHDAGWRTITFEIMPQAETMDGTTIATWYESPLTLRAMRMRSSVIRWARVDGKPPEKSCAVHGERMHIELLPVHGSGPPAGMSPDLETFVRSFVAEFPNSGESIDTGCMVPPEKFAEAYICNACQAARKAWLAARGLERPPPR